MSNIKTYVKKSIHVQMIQWDGTNERAEEIISWAGKENIEFKEEEKNNLMPRIHIKTTSGWMPVAPNHYIAKGVNDYYPVSERCKDETYTDYHELENTEVEVTDPELTKTLELLFDKRKAIKSMVIDLAIELKRIDDNIPLVVKACYPELEDYHFNIDYGCKIPIKIVDITKNK